MRPLVLSLRHRPDQRLDLSPLLPHALARRTVAEIEQTAVNTTRHRLSVGDVFRVRAGDAQQIRIEGSCDRLDLVGHGMRGGVVVVRGAAGDRAGDRMRRGSIIVEGSAGSHAGSRMLAGTLIVRRTAGPMPGYLMRRGTIVLGSAGALISPTFVDCGTHDLIAMRLLARFRPPV